MLFHALHRNGQIYPYETENKDDRDLWFEGPADDILGVFLMKPGNGPVGYPYVGVQVRKAYADGAMDHARSLEDKDGKEEI